MLLACRHLMDKSISQFAARQICKQPEEAQAAAQDNLARGEARADASHLADAGASQGLNAPNDQGSSLDQLSADENARLQAAFRHCGRNDPCPCGSGKKFKDCHGRLR